MKTTHLHPLKYRLIFNYFQQGHKCGRIPTNLEKLIKCDCPVFFKSEPKILQGIINKIKIYAI